MSAPILITVPKYVAISPSPMPRTLQPAVPPPGDVPSGDCPRAKKRRLDHLTWEEKIQRKKLKNRVAAQTSRDRKKARMEDMEHTIAMLTQQTEILQNKCDSLQAINESLLSKNEKLDHQVEKLQKEIEELRRQQASEPAIVPSDSVGCGTKPENRSAESRYPLPKGKLVPESTACDRKGNSAALWQIIALCLLYKTCSKTSMPASLKSSPKAFSQISQQTWKEAIRRASQMMPKVQAERSDCLDQWWGPQQSTWNPAKIAACTA